jgi:hypothetical protein
MKPRIQYAKTKDGVSIAFATLGDGMPLVYVPSAPYTHVQLGWQLPTRQRLLYEGLAGSQRLFEVVWE